MSLKPEERRTAGVSGKLVRLSVGLQDEPDLISDLNAALARLPAANDCIAIDSVATC